jgi:hypothetical protein
MTDITPDDGLTCSRCKTDIRKATLASLRSWLQQNVDVETYLIQRQIGGLSKYTQRSCWLRIIYKIDELQANAGEH